MGKVRLTLKSDDGDISVWSGNLPEPVIGTMKDFIDACFNQHKKMVEAIIEMSNFLNFADKNKDNMEESEKNDNKN